MSETIAPWIETAIRAAASEIQRRNKERNWSIMQPNGEKEPVVTVEEMTKIMRQFIHAAEDSQ